MRLIDADELKSVFTEKSTEAVCGAELCKAIISRIDDTPTIDAVPVRHEKWERENKYGVWKCSGCGCKVNRVNPLKGNIWNYYYCPNCGARMDKYETH